MKARAVDIALLVLRLALGTIFLAHGSQKLFGWFDGGGLAPTTQFVGALGFKPAVVWAVLLALAEFGGGLLVLLGLLARFGAAAILIGQLVAVIKVHGPRGFFLQNQGFEYNLSLIAIAVALILAGAGMYSLDWLIRNRRR